MKVLLNDGLEKEGLELFKQAGIETDTKKRDPKALVADIAEFDALVVRSATKVTREVLEAGAKGKLKIVGRSGVGFDNIDVEAASEFGIVVKIAPYGSTNAVAELAIGLMLSASRNIPKLINTSKRRVGKEQTQRHRNAQKNAGSAGLWTHWSTCSRHRAPWL